MPQREKSPLNSLFTHLHCECKSLSAKGKQPPLHEASTTNLVLQMQRPDTFTDADLAALTHASTLGKDPLLAHVQGMAVDEAVRIHGDGLPGKASQRVARVLDQVLPRAHVRGPAVDMKESTNY